MDQIDSKETKMPSSSSSAENKQPQPDSSSKITLLKEGRMKKRKGYAGLGCAMGSIFTLILLTVGVIGGMYVYPSFNNWLDDRGVVLFPSQSQTLDGGSTDTNKSSSSTVVSSDEESIINVVKENSESVVSVAITQLEFSPDSGVINQNSNIGSGFIVDGNGLIITNQHVVSDTASNYVVITSDSKEYKVKEILRDDLNDIALLKIDAEGLKPLTLGDSSAILVGQRVVAFGTPLGEFAGSVTTGIVSGLNRSVTTGTGSFFGVSKTFEDVIQTDAAINPGNSGGPLLNLSGEVIGINFATSSGADNISFALPINRVKSRLDEYRKFGKFVKPYIGIEYQIITEANAASFSDIVPGAFIRNVVPGSPAEKAGLKNGDIITKVGDEQVDTLFAFLLQQYKVGDKVDMTVWNNNKARTVTVTLGEAE
ncbi:trypsin-like peptidase domain-containing protein [Candidatus Dojkabacteria bacterium]|uniref:Trypsin-like peptidase domain-containing protein n=1 Tax=Candidatus Dojkabacteria bacterium TaxID=2099670 RepID=A0A955HYG6_9BACT|nr:trypsin-like peptidase domain-containing protein [Candidatus Dojkabacteria bacterium]MCB9790628.1 trypsin-like peptidase domain-containing protein [Candidatus Nomurabacteria bacterium]